MESYLINETRDPVEVISKGQTYIKNSEFMEIKLFLYFLTLLYKQERLIG